MMETGQQEETKKGRGCVPDNRPLNRLSLGTTDETFIHL